LSRRGAPLSSARWGLRRFSGELCQLKQWHFLNIPCTPVLEYVAVMPAALGVFGTGTGWPDIIVASAMAALSLWGAGQISNHAWNELRTGKGRVLSSAPAE
jgi:hypothetical protein